MAIWRTEKLIQSLIVDPDSRILAEQIADRTKNDVPVVIEMTALRRGSSPGRNHVDAINFFEGVMERLDRTVPGGWPRTPTWCELDHGSKHRQSGQRLYLYVHARIGLSEMRRLDIAAADLARSMDVCHGLGLAPGFALTSQQIHRHGVGGARNALLDLVAKEPDENPVHGLYTVRARWTVAVRPAGIEARADRAPHRGRLYLTLVRQRSTSTGVSPVMRFDTGARAHLSTHHDPASVIAHRAAGQSGSDRS